MKINLTKKATDFLDKHSVAISDGVKTFIALAGGIGSMVLGTVILKMNGVDISFGDVVSEVKKDPEPLDYNKLAEEAINKTKRRAIDAFYDSEKKLAAKDIRDIAMRDGLTTAKLTAINALSEICEDVLYDCSKTEIGTYIKEIATSF